MPPLNRSAKMISSGVPVFLRQIIVDDSIIGIIGAISLGLIGMSFGLCSEYRRAKSPRGRWFVLAFGFCILVVMALIFAVCLSLIR